MEDRYAQKQGSHRLVIDNRRQMEISGVRHVDSFDDQEIILETDLGLLAIRGEELHINQLSLDQGDLKIEGLVLEVVYSEDKQFRDRGKGLFERLFR